jgi:hypothetical protein
MHNRPWLRALVQMLAAEFGVPVGFSRELAREGGIEL